MFIEITFGYDKYFKTLFPIKDITFIDDDKIALSLDISSFEDMEFWDNNSRTCNYDEFLSYNLLREIASNGYQFFANLIDWNGNVSEQLMITDFYPEISFDSSFQRHLNELNLIGYLSPYKFDYFRGSFKDWMEGYNNYWFNYDLNPLCKNGEKIKEIIDVLLEE